jgi:hypothetical protein
MLLVPISSVQRLSVDDESVLFADPFFLLGARAYYLHSIMQDWEDSTCQQILRSLIPAMKPGYSKILINDFVIPNQGAHWLQTSLDWELMAALGSRHRTEEEMKTMIAGAGLKMVEIFQHPQSVDSLIEVDLA